MMAVSSKCLLLLPILTCILPLLTTVASYLIGIFHKGHPKVLFPSDLMVEQPERGVFDVGLDVSVALTMVVLLLRFAQIHSCGRWCRKLNHFTLVVGILMVLGQILVPAFSLKEDAAIHYTGAILYFGAGSTYMILQAHISRKYRYHHSTCIIVFRILFAVLGCIPPTAYTAARLFAPKEENRYYILQGSEWTLALLIYIFIGSFSWDFSQLTIALDSKEVRQRNEAGDDVFLTQDVTAM